MKYRVASLLLFCSLWVAAQKPVEDFAAIDAYVRTVQTATPDSLAQRLVTNCTTDLMKVRAIYSWICQHIAYNTNLYRPLRLRTPFVPGPPDTSTQWKPADEMVAESVLRRGVAVCEGYSRLFKVLCQYAGLEAVVLNGYARTGYNRASERFRTNHTWNAVRVDSVWHLLDVTWAAGYMTYDNAFVQEQNDFYFLTLPEAFMRDHFPEDLRWSLLAQPPLLAEFKKMPFKSKSFLKYDIQSYSPAPGLLEAGIGDTLYFTISLVSRERAKTISTDAFLDTASYRFSPASAFLKPESEAGNTAFYRFVVDAHTQWVHLLYNEDVILRYCVRRRNFLTGP